MDFVTATEVLGPYKLQILSVSVALIVVVVSTCFVLRRRQQARQAAQARPRMRKRDRLRSWVRSASESIGLRRVNSEGSIKRVRKRDRVLKVARDLFKGFSAPQAPFPQQRQGAKAPPAHLLEPASDMPASDVPLEVRLTLQKLQVFGSFKEAMFAELFKHAETIKLDKGESLFNVGDPDDSMYIVLRGEIVLRSVGTERDRQGRVLSVLSSGDNLSSLLSLLDVLTGSDSRFKTLCSQANEDDTAVLKIPASGFQKVIERHPESFRQFVRVVTVRLQRVTLFALHRFCGLNEQLVCQPKTPEPPSYLARSSALSLGNSDDDILDKACDDIAVKLGLVDEQDWREHCFLERASAETTVVEQGMLSDLIYVLSGKLGLFLEDDHDEPRLLYEVPAGMFTGELAVLSVVGSFADCAAIEDCLFVRVSSEALISIMDRNPDVVGKLTQLALKLVSPLVRRVDLALTWVHLQAGQALFHQGDEAHAIALIINGRVRSVVENNGKKEIEEEFGRLEVVGDIEVLTKTKRSSTAIAIRETEIVRLPGALLHAIRDQYPEILIHIMRTMSLKMRSKLDGPSAHKAKSNLSTIALLPVSASVPMTLFVTRLQQALSCYGPTKHLNSSVVAMETGLNPNCHESFDDYRLSGWLEAQEDRHTIVLYETDCFFSRWTSRCFKHADCVLVVGVGHEEPSLSPLEIQLENVASRAQKELVLLHSPSTKLPKRTADWLNMRTYVGAHHHIRVGADVLPDPIESHSKKKKTRASYRRTEPATSDEIDESVELDEPGQLATMTKKQLILSDYGRLARHLAGCSIGLVLGGGGAKGMAHLGVIKCLEDAGIPIDMVGGTSMGAFIGGVLAEERGYLGTNLCTRTRQLTAAMGNYGLQALDLTYPVTSLFTGRCFNRALEDVFKSQCLEDLWLPYFCITTDISDSKMRVHSQGSMWRYIRASMSLAGYLPPLCDPVDGHLLLDGGYVSNVPVDVMRSRGARFTIAVDVGSSDVAEFTNFGDELSGLWLLWRKWNPFLTAAKVPDMETISSRLAYITSRLQLSAEVLSARADFLYLRPPIDPFGTLQWAASDEIEKVGLDFMQLRIQELISRVSDFHPLRSGTPLPGERSRRGSISMPKSDDPSALVAISSLTDLSPIRTSFGVALTDVTTAKSARAKALFD